MLFEIKEKTFYGKKRIFEKNFISTTPPFMAILPTGDLFGTPIVNIQGFKSFSKYFSSKMLFEIKKGALGRNEEF